MTRLLKHLDTEVLIEYAHFHLEDETLGVPRPPEFGAGAEWLITADNRLTIRSASGLYHLPAVRLEQWDQEPAEINKPWETQRDATVRLMSGRLGVLSALGSGQSVFDLGGPGAYRVRAYSAGRERIHEALQEAEEGPVHGVERYLLQFWHAR